MIIYPNRQTLGETKSSIVKWKWIKENPNAYLIYLKRVVPDFIVTFQFLIGTFQF